MPSPAGRDWGGEGVQGSPRPREGARPCGGVEGVKRLGNLWQFRPQTGIPGWGCDPLPDGRPVPRKGGETWEYFNIFAFMACLSFSSVHRFPVLKTRLIALLGF